MVDYNTLTQAGKHCFDKIYLVDLYLKHRSNINQLNISGKADYSIQEPTMQLNEIGMFRISACATGDVVRQWLDIVSNFG